MVVVPVKGRVRSKARGMLNRDSHNIPETDSRPGRLPGNLMPRIIADSIDLLIRSRGVAVLMLDSSPVLAGLYSRLCAEEDVAWTRVIGFQLSEWRGRAEGDPGSGRRMLLDSLVCRVPMAEFHGLRGEAANPAAVCANYRSLLETRRPDLAIVALRADGRVGTPPIVEAGGRVVCRSDSIGITFDSLVECGRIFAVVGEEYTASEMSLPPSFSLFDRD